MSMFSNQPRRTSLTFDLQLLNVCMLNKHARAGKSQRNLKLDNHRK